MMLVFDGLCPVVGWWLLVSHLLAGVLSRLENSPTMAALGWQFQSVPLLLYMNGHSLTDSPVIDRADVGPDVEPVDDGL
jgi:hypothetical protein